MLTETFETCLPLLSSAGPLCSIAGFTWADSMTSSASFASQALTPVFLVTLTPWPDPPKLLNWNILSALPCCCHALGKLRSKRTTPFAHWDLQGISSSPSRIHHTSRRRELHWGPRSVRLQSFCAFHFASLPPSVCTDSQHSLPKKQILIPYRKDGKQLQLPYPFPGGQAC